MNQYIITEEVAGIIETALESDEHCKKCPYEGGGFEQGALSLLRECPYQSEWDCPVCGGGLMCHRWCIDRDCGWDSVKGTPAGTLAMNHPGFALNSIKRTGARLKALRERRKHIENQIEELRDKLYIIDGEIVALGTV